MSTEVRTGGAVPLYARTLRLRRLRITGLASFLLVEGTISTAVLLALAELVSWWAVPLLPALVAAVVKINDSVGKPMPADVQDAVAPDPVAGQITVKRTAAESTHDWSRPSNQGADRSRQRVEPDARRPRQRAGQPDQAQPDQRQSDQAQPQRSTVAAGMPAPAGAEPAWGRHAVRPATDEDPGVQPTGVPGSQAQRRAHIIGAAVRRSMAQAQLGANGGGNGFANGGGMGHSAGSPGRHSRREETTERQARRNDRGFGRFA